MGIRHLAFGVLLLNVLLTHADVKGSIASDLLALDLSASGSKEFAIDIRDSSIIWINDLEHDAQYRRWPSSVMDLLRPTFPGMLRNIRKNLFNLVLLVDPITPDVRGIIKLAESFVVHLAPVHLGIVFDTSKGVGDRNELYRSINCAFNYLTQTKSPRDALGYLTDVRISSTSVRWQRLNGISFRRYSPQPMQTKMSR